MILDRQTEIAQQIKTRLQVGEALPDLLLVDNTLRAYQAIAGGYRQTLNATVIGVTGSVGKTTTRRMIGAAMRSQMTVHETDANLNNQIGLALTLLETQSDAQAVVAEMAMDRRGKSIH